MTDIGTLRERYAAASEDARRASTDRSQLLTSLEAVQRHFDAARRGEPLDGTDEVVSELETLAAGWRHERSELAAVGLTAEEPRFRKFGVETPQELPGPLQEAFDAGAGQRFEDVMSPIEDAVAGGGDDFEPLETVVADLERAFEDRDRAAFEAATAALVEGFEKRGVETRADLLKLLEAERGPFVGEALLRLGTDRDALESELDALTKAIVDADSAAYASARLPFDRAGRALDAFARRRRADLGDVTADLVATYPSGHDDEHPALDHENPVLLTPTRLETRFSRRTDGNGDPVSEPPRYELLVRVYPDDLHVDTHERALTAAEVDGGTRFWAQVWWASHTGSADELQANLPADRLETVDLSDFPTDPAERHAAVLERAWTRLEERFGAERAAWVKRAMAPDDAATLLAGPPENGHVADADPAAFEAAQADRREAVDRRPGSWTRPPRARLLPDQWIAFAETDGDEVTATSGPVQRPLSIGPDPGALQSSVETADDHDAMRSGEIEWVFDYETAEDVGMVLRIPLTQAQRDAGVDRLTVLGVSTARDATAGAIALADLLEGHRYTDGLELLERGTPTNDTRDDPAGTTPSGGLTPFERQCVQEPVAASDADADAARLADLLGLDPAVVGTDRAFVLDRVPGADGRTAATAGAANAALWSATWGYYVPHLLAPRNWAENVYQRRQLLQWLEDYRRHFVSYVRAGGPAPPLRVGDQPYGVLPTTAYDDWQPVSALAATPETDVPTNAGDFQYERYADDDVSAHLDGLLDAVRPHFESALGQVPTAGDAGDPNLIASDLLSMAGTSYGYRLREFLGSDAMATIHEGSAVESAVGDARAATAAQLQSASSWGHVPRIGDLLARQDADVVEVPTVDDDLSEVLHALRTTRHDGLRAGPPGVDEGLDLDIGDGLGAWLLTLFDNDDDSVAATLCYDAILQEYRLARVRLADHYENWAQRYEAGAAWTDGPWSLVPEPQTYDDGDLTMWDALEDQVPKPLAGHPDAESDWRIGDILREIPAVDRPFAELIDGFRTLEDADPAVAEQAVSETLDLASHRFDAWQTSLATRRLEGMRNAGSEGVYVGAYGYVEDLRPESGDRSTGYVHAPSIDQATAAAVLRSVHDAETDEYGDLFAVDLSSDRVRDALDLLEGVRAGHSLGELLGTRFERALHEDHPDVELDQYVYAFRALAPLVEGSIDRQGMSESDAVAERETVDGVTLHDLWREDAIPWGQQVGRSEMDPLPDPSTAADQAAYDAITAELDAIGTALDSVSDLLAVESVYQLVQNNPERAGSALDALSRGGSVDEVEVARTPRTGTSCTHRVAALLDAEADESAWAPGQSPRAAAEPALEDWVGTFLGDPARVVCRAAYRPDTDDTDESGASDSGTASGGGGSTTGNGEESEPTWRVVAVRLSQLDLAALDVVSLVEGDEGAWASELEGRIAHYLRQSREDVPADGEIRLSFEAPAAWPDAAALGADPDQDVGFDELLEVAKTVGSVVSGGRPLDAQDLAPPGQATAEGQVVGDLDERADAAVSTFEGAVETLGVQSAVLAVDEGTGDRAVGDLLALTEAIEAIPTAPVRTASERVAEVESDDLRTELDALAGAVAGDHVRFARTERGEIRLDPERPVLRGLADPDLEKIEVVTRANGRRLQATTGRIAGNGRVRAGLDVEQLSPGDRLEIEVSDGRGWSETVAATVATDPERHSVAGPALLALGAADDALVTVADAAALAAAAGDALADGVVDAAIADFETPPWTAQAEADLAAVREVPGASLPGLQDPGGWQRVAPVLAAVGEEPVTADHVTNAKLTSSVPTESALESLLDALADGLDVVDLGIDAAGREPQRAYVAAALEAVREALLTCADFGVQGCVPVTATGSDESDLADLARQADSVYEEVADTLATATDHRDRGDAETEPAAYVDCLETLFGEAFTVLVPFEPTNPGEVRKSLAPAHSESLQGGDPLAVERWFDRVSRVRDELATFGRALTYGETLGARSPADGPRFRVGQFPYGAGDPWVGLPDAWDGEHPSGRLSVAADVRGGQSGPRYVGLFVDEFVETVPTETETTGLTFHYDRPSQQAPQSMLLAVPPTDADWSVSTLADVVRESVDLAKLRTVDRDALDAGGQLLPALAFATNESADPAGPDTASIDPADLMPDWWQVAGFGGGD
ncbi:hypothetical protein [Halobaculum gomorrense]|uniref:Uncharacterized protein n=1 Tax=Halobaculum gomorrense TaxID=43928 RepID=A0A1M5PFI5_9EURY|nr:hypothetical protein [Halobaculum gomorrense]SHH00510.1 hypothetical protein SAMN05443636_1580 [Halobaculum gomorrense]